MGISHNLRPRTSRTIERIGSATDYRAEGFRRLDDSTTSIRRHKRSSRRQSLCHSLSRHSIHRSPQSRSLLDFRNSCDNNRAVISTRPSCLASATSLGSVRRHLCHYALPLGLPSRPLAEPVLNQNAMHAISNLPTPSFSKALRR